MARHWAGCRTQIAKLLIGKHKAMFAPNTDTGDFVVVINAAKIRVTGKKMTEKDLLPVSGYPGGIRSVRLGEMLEKHPERVIEHAVKGYAAQQQAGQGHV